MKSFFNSQESSEDNDIKEIYGIDVKELETLSRRDAWELFFQQADREFGHLRTVPRALQSQDAVNSALWEWDRYMEGKEARAKKQAQKQAQKQKKIEEEKLPENPKIEVDDILDTIDEVSGVETVTVIGADNKKKRITRKLPLTPEEKEVSKMTSALFTESLKNLETLYSLNPEKVIPYQELITKIGNINTERFKDKIDVATLDTLEQSVTNFQNIQKDLLDETWNKIEDQHNSYLSFIGQSNSSAAHDLRARLGKSKAMSYAQVNLEGEERAVDILAKKNQEGREAWRDREFKREQDLMGLNSELSLLEKYQAALEKQKSDLINQNLQGIQLAQGLEESDLKRRSLDKSHAMGLAEYTAKGQQATNEMANRIQNFNAHTGRLSAEGNLRLGEQGLEVEKQNAATQRRVADNQLTIAQMQAKAAVDAAEAGKESIGQSLIGAAGAVGGGFLGWLKGK